MRKQEFLDELKQTLSGEVPAEIMMDTYRYYANYIDEEIQNGKEEETVLAELGKPKSIKQALRPLFDQMTVKSFCALPFLRLIHRTIRLLHH